MKRVNIISSDHSTQIRLTSDGVYRKVTTMRSRKIRYDPFAPEEEYVKNPWLLEDQIGDLTYRVEKNIIPPELVERRVYLLDTAISAMATNPYFNTRFITQFLWILALRLLWRNYGKQAEIIVDRACFIDRVICRNPDFNGDLMHTAGKVKMGIEKFSEAIKIFKTGIRNSEKKFEEEFNVAFWLADLAVCYMGLDQYENAADAYGRIDELCPPRGGPKTEWSTSQDPYRKKLIKLGYPPNIERHQPRSEVEYRQGMKKKHKEYLAKLIRTT